MNPLIKFSSLNVTYLIHEQSQIIMIMKTMTILLISPIHIDYAHNIVYVNNEILSCNDHSRSPDHFSVKTVTDPPTASDNFCP